MADKLKLKREKNVNLNKIFTPRVSTEEPDKSPRHINHVTFTRIGLDFYMDVGVVPAEQILEVEDRSAVDLHIFDRYALSRGGFELLKQNLKQIDASLTDTIEVEGAEDNE